MLAWARDHVAGLAKLRDPVTPDFTGLGKGKGAVTLYAPESLFSHASDSKPGLCRRVTFAVEPRVLSADVPFDRGDGVPKMVQPGKFEELHLGETVSVYGPHELWVGTNDKGERIDGMRASPLVSHTGHALLSVTPDEIRYGAVPVRAEVLCDLWEARPCAADDGTPSKRTRCTKLGIEYRSLSSSHMFGRASPLHVRLGTAVNGPLPSCRSGPADELSSMIAPLTRLLANRRYLWSDDSLWPVFSRAPGPCQRAERAQHPP